LGSGLNMPSVKISGQSKIAYFTGCGMRMMFPDAVEGTIRILRTLTELQIIDNLCCGLPHLAHGLRSEFLEMAGADTCCGGAGSFHIDYPDIAQSILHKKQRHIENSGAHIVVSECPTCLVQLSKAAVQSGGKFKVMHISQVL